MVGILLVSHSAKLVEGLDELLKQVVGDVSIVTAGGDEDGNIGTHFDKIQAAVEEAGSGDDGALVFYDLGSAKMNAEMAIEVVESEDVRLVSYPIVEGSYLAAVEASIGKSLDDILASLEKEFG
ncbi:PTS-dependent dihydroxyacetone kinase phosphotransferase subunit DhaM [Halobacillus locisalis]|uniref:phosphoenolpyruvate--glycerone phosphotransferase n=1 Tax=Halobacillus locisalis TaxID=220753 RepID=A0A838CVS4_9BACI|nr:dihydroxyacetone kinase phosphoryl donor subunit DhaM [Halobacillus locisalis]MBA2176034.1 PTS-dependent dihydroxyacetone kinase phosphotransferase subunit DhaM [Halobacillus locisalis]